jgi:hypothetical protein
MELYRRHIWISSQIAAALDEFRHRSLEEEETFRRFNRLTKMRRFTGLRRPRISQGLTAGVFWTATCAFWAS